MNDTRNLRSYLPAVAAGAVFVFDATSNALNSTVTLVTSLLTALIPLFIVVGIFGLVIGLFVGEHGIFRKLERQ